MGGCGSSDRWGAGVVEMVALVLGAEKATLVPESR